jgi:hypothetical protein
VEISEILALGLPTAVKGFAFGALASGAFLVYALAGAWRHQEFSLSRP